MATWIVHLRIAEALLAQLDDVEPALFAIGNVAPDSGIPDEKWETFDPPGKVTHFRQEPDMPWQCVDLAFYRTYLAPVSRHEAHEQFSFLLGYFFHLITDNLWHDQIYLPTRTRFAAQFKIDPKFIWEVKRDWYGLDFLYVRTRPDSLFWTIFLASEYTQNYLDFLPQHAIQHNLRHIKTFYQKTDEETENWFIQRPEKYLSDEEMDAFVDRATKMLMQIYQRLWDGHTVSIPEGRTVLDVFSS